MTDTTGPALFDRSRAPVLGTWVKLQAVEIVEVLAVAGFDFVVIDLEHTMLGPETVSTMIGVARGMGLPSIVRLPDHGHSMIQRVLDAGAAGVMVPQVNTVEQAQDLVSKSKFPPIGTRGVSASGRTGGWGSTPIERYLRAGDDSVVIVQLESEAAVRQAVSIAAVPGIDAVFLGPSDLAASMGERRDSPRFQQLISELETDCAANEIDLGTAVGDDGDVAAGLLRRGYRMLVLSSDGAILRSGAARLVQSVKATTKEKQ